MEELEQFPWFKGCLDDLRFEDDLTKWSRRLGEVVYNRKYKLGKGIILFGLEDHFDIMWLEQGFRLSSDEDRLTTDPKGEGEDEIYFELIYERR